MQRKDVAMKRMVTRWCQGIAVVALCGCLLTACSKDTEGNPDEMSPKEMKAEIYSLRQERDRQTNTILDRERTIRTLQEELERTKAQSNRDMKAQEESFLMKQMWSLAISVLGLVASFVFGVILGSRAHKAAKEAKAEATKEDMA